jgi:hypothetical protein
MTHETIDHVEGQDHTRAVSESEMGEEMTRENDPKQKDRVSESEMGEMAHENDHGDGEDHTKAFCAGGSRYFGPPADAWEVLSKGGMYVCVYVCMFLSLADAWEVQSKGGMCVCVCMHVMYVSQASTE